MFPTTIMELIQLKFRYNKLHNAYKYRGLISFVYFLHLNIIGMFAVNHDFNS